MCRYDDSNLGNAVLVRAGREVVAEPQDAVAALPIGHDLLSNQVTQRLGCASTERAVARATIEPRHQVLVGESVAAMQLHRLAGHPDGHLVAEHLCCSREEWIGKRICGGTGSIQQAAAGFDI